MKNLFIILLTFIIAPYTCFSQEISENTGVYRKFRTLKVGIDLSDTYWKLSGPSLGPRVGIAFEKWKTSRRGFSTELIAGFSEGLNIRSGREIKNTVSLTVPILWCFRGKYFGFKTGLQPRLFFITPYGEQIKKGSGQSINPTLLSELQFPLVVTYYADKNFSLDFKLSLPAYFPFVGNLSFSLTAGWCFNKNSHTSTP